NESFARLVEVASHGYVWRSGLTVPAPELRHVAAAGACKALNELLDGGGLAIMASEIEVHAGTEFLFADQCLHHPHQFGPFFVDGGRIEVVDLPISFRADRMCERSGVFDELSCPKRSHVGDALDGPRTHIGGKFLIAEYGEAF